jgi:hypothetical protein
MYLPARFMVQHGSPISSTAPLPGLMALTVHRSAKNCGFLPPVAGGISGFGSPAGAGLPAKNPAAPVHLASDRPADKAAKPATHSG